MLSRPVRAALAYSIPGDDLCAINRLYPFLCVLCQGLPDAPSQAYAFDTLEAEIMFLRQGSRLIPPSTAVQAYRPSNGHISGDVDQSQLSAPRHEAALDGCALVSREGQVPDTSHTDPMSAARALRIDGDSIAALRSQPELAGPSEQPASQSHTGTGVASHTPDRLHIATQASNEQGAATQSMRLEAQHMALPTQDNSGIMHALEPPQDPQGETQSGDWREQQQRWLQTPSGLAEAAGLQVKPGSHADTLPASTAQSEEGPEDRLPGLGNQQRHPLNPIKVSRSSTPGLDPASACM